MVIEELKEEIISLIGVRDAQLLITGILDISVTDYMLSGKKEISDDTATRIRSGAKRILSGEPLQYVVGMTEFMSLKFHVREGILVPRADTETLVEKAIQIIGEKPVSVLDIGTGSGCVAISIAHYCKNSNVTSVDISETALEIAKGNGKLNRADVEFTKCDIMTEMPEGTFDIIVSNPPYIPSKVIDGLDKNVKDFEPRLALDGGCDGLDFYRRITHIAPKLLNTGGALLYEVGHDQAEAVKGLMEKDFKNIEITKDLCNINRVVTGTLKAAEN